MKIPLALATALLGLSLASLAEEALPLGQLSHIHGIAVNPADTRQLYLATHHGVFLASPDGTAVAVSESRDDFMGFSPHPTEAGTFYGSGHPAGGGNLGFIASTDGGRTWRQLSPGVKGPVDFHAMTVSRADPAVIYGTHGGLQVSRDGGHSWALVGPLPGRVLDIAAPEGDPDTLYAATAEGLLVSDDGGRSWQPAYMRRAPTSMVEAGAEGTVYAFMLGVGLVKSQSMGWTRLNDGFGEDYILHLAEDPTDASRLYAATRKGALLRSEDGGRTWRPYAS